MPKRSQTNVGCDPSIANDQQQLLRGKTNKKDGDESTHPSAIQGWKEHLFDKPAEPSPLAKKENLTEESASETERVQNKLEVNSQPKSESTHTASAPVEKTNEKDESSPAKTFDVAPNSTKRKPKKLKRANGRRRPASTMRNQQFRIVTDDRLKHGVDHRTRKTTFCARALRGS
jgi:hypothetical protein